MSIMSNKNYLLSLSRSAGFIAQNLSLPLIEKILVGNTPLPKRSLSDLQTILKELHLLLAQDAKDLHDLGIVLGKPDLSTHPLQLTRYLDVLVDGYAVSKRRLQKKTKDINNAPTQFKEDTPSYYQRNFHFQTDGYFSTKSADRYDYQVEILFAGGADPMRRLLLKPLAHHTPTPLKVLELGVGTGSLTRQVRKLLPKSHITCIDLSSPYLWKARQNLQDQVSIDFIQADAADLSFKDESFDAVVSCFLFHELPLKERKQVLKESLRVLKPGGFLGIVDSLQAGDNPKLDWALQDFPIRFHEPFFKNYTEYPLEGLLSELDVISTKTRLGYFAKCVTANKTNPKS